MRALSLRSALVLAIAAAAVSGCGSDTVSVGGTLEGAPRGWTVWAVEAEREARVEDGRFELDEMVPGPITLELRDGGKPVGRIELHSLPAGASLRMDGLRVEPGSGRAFPRSVELDGADVAWINGIRMAEPGAVPAQVDAPGVVLASSRDGSALLFRPSDARLPDLRVVVTPATAWSHADSTPANARPLEEGDSVRVSGGAEQGYVVASRLTLPASATALSDSGDSDSLAMRDDDAPPGDDPPPTSGARASEDDDGGEAAREGGSASPVAVSRAPVARAPVIAPRGRGHGRGHEGGGPGRGRGHGKGKG